MKLVDANLLLYAVDEASPHHVVAKPWLEEQLSGSENIHRVRAQLYIESIDFAYGAGVT